MATRPTTCQTDAVAREAYKRGLARAIALTYEHHASAHWYLEHLRKRLEQELAQA